MLTNIIEFSAPKDYVKVKENLPVPIKTNLPAWFKNLSNSDDDMTIKKCMPFLQTLTSGYLLKTPIDIEIKHNFKNDQGERRTLFNTRMAQEAKGNININTHGHAHSFTQLENSPFIKKNLDFDIYKILNPWKIKTPKGYSCLCLPPLNNRDDRFEIFSGIVETDAHEIEINFPFCVNGDKYPVLNTTIKKGTPYVQIIPFKRDNWRIKISENIDGMQDHFSFLTWAKKFYKEKLWKKTSWK